MTNIIKKVIMYSGQDCCIFKDLVAQQILDSIKGLSLKGLDNVYEVDQTMYLRVREKIPFFQEKPMLVNFFQANYTKKIVVEESQKLDDIHMMEMMLLVEKINNEEKKNK